MAGAWVWGRVEWPVSLYLPSRPLDFMSVLSIDSIEAIRQPEASFISVPLINEVRPMARTVVSIGGLGASPSLWSFLASNIEFARGYIGQLLAYLNVDGVEWRLSGNESSLPSNLNELFTAMSFFQVLTFQASTPLELISPDIIENEAIDFIVLEVFSEETGMVDGWADDLTRWAASESMDEEVRHKTFVGVCIQFSPSILAYVTPAWVNEVGKEIASHGFGGMAFWMFAPYSPGTPCLRDLID